MGMRRDARAVAGERQTTPPTIVLFTRVPVPGRAKTRLLPALPAHACSMLQEAMAHDEAERLASLGMSLAIHYSNEADGLADADAVEARFCLRMRGVAPDARLCPQVGAGLGERMDAAITSELGRGAPWCLLMGSDLPLVTVELVYEAIDAFGNSDALLCPSDDGGYWMVGLRRPCPALFAGKRYGTGSVLEEACAACRASGLEVALGPVTRDIDTPDDLAWLRGLVQAGDRRVGPRTGRCVRALEPANL